MAQPFAVGVEQSCGTAATLCRASGCGSMALGIRRLVRPPRSTGPCLPKAVAVEVAYPGRPRARLSSQAFELRLSNALPNFVSTRGCHAAAGVPGCLAEFLRDQTCPSPERSGGGWQRCGGSGVARLPNKVSASGGALQILFIHLLLTAQSHFAANRFVAPSLLRLCKSSAAPFAIVCNVRVPTAPSLADPHHQHMRVQRPRAPACSCA